MLEQIAGGIATQFGESCEVVIHDLSCEAEHSIVAIYNGHVTGRKKGDGASNVVLEQLQNQDDTPEDHCCYLTRTDDGKILKSSTIYIRNKKGKAEGILAINYDISRLLMAKEALHDLVMVQEPARTKEPEKIVKVNELLDNLIQQSVAVVGKPVALMTKEDKIRAVHFLNNHGAFLVTKSSDKAAKYFGISKYTLYSYLDADCPDDI